MAQKKIVTSNAPSQSAGGQRRSCLDNVFSSQRPMFSLSQRVWNPPADMYETRDSIVIKMEVAGIRLDTLEITMDGHYLIIRGCRTDDASVGQENFHLMEIRYGRFERFFQMPHKLSAEEVDAQYGNGFLVISIERKQPVSRRIPVKSGD